MENDIPTLFGICLLTVLSMSRATATDSTPPAGQCLSTVNGHKLEICRAVYTSIDSPQSLDVTEKLTPLVQSGQLNIQVGNTTFVIDPSPGHRKELRVEYVLDGKPGSIAVPEHDPSCNTLDINWRIETQAQPAALKNWRDVVKEVSEACKKQGIQFGCYYSVPDTHNPDYPFALTGGAQPKREKYDVDACNNFLMAQTAELLRNYGPLTDSAAKSARIILELPAQTKISSAHILQREDCANRILAYEFQVEQNVGWKTLCAGEKLGADEVLKFEPFTAKKFRLNITKATGGATINEIELN